VATSFSFHELLFTATALIEIDCFRRRACVYSPAYSLLRNFNVRFFEMKKFWTRQSPDTVVKPFGIILLIFVAAFTAPAQPRNPRVDSARKNEQDLMSREWNLTHMTEQIDKQFKQDQIHLFPEIKKDFSTLQTTNNDLMRSIFVSNVIDYGAIADAMSEIRKRALHLKQNLALPKLSEPPPANQTEIRNDQQLKVSLLTLDRSVMSFVKNPIFQSPGVIDQTSAMNATQDLEGIIQITNIVKKQVEKLKSSVKQ
jgi:hypothetical protein